MIRNSKIKLLFILLLCAFSLNALSQNDLKKTFDSQKVIDGLLNKRLKVVQAIYKSQNDSLNLFEKLDKENFVLSFLQKEGQDSLALITGNLPNKVFLAGEFIYSHTLNENNEKCDIYKGSGFQIFQKESMGAIFSVQMIPDSLEDFGIEHYVLWIIFEDNSNIHFRFQNTE